MNAIRKMSGDDLTAAPHGAICSGDPDCTGADRWTLLPSEGCSIRLSRREIECLEWVARGLQDDRIAARLNISRSTVRLHISTARRKLKARTREQALVRAVLLKLIAP